MCITVFDFAVMICKCGILDGCQMLSLKSILKIFIFLKFQNDSIKSGGQRSDQSLLDQHLELKKKAEGT